MKKCLQFEVNRVLLDTDGFLKHFLHDQRVRFIADLGAAPEELRMTPALHLKVRMALHDDIFYELTKEGPERRLWGMRLVDDPTLRPDDPTLPLPGEDRWSFLIGRMVAKV